MLLLALAAGAADAADRSASAYVQARYAMNVAEHCGLATERAAAGFAALERRLVVEEGLDAESTHSARVSAGIAFAREYNNRGLGGARGWCRTEGAEAARRFEAVPLD